MLTLNPPVQWLEIHRVAVVGPGAEFHLAFLLVEREEGDIDETRATEATRRVPEDGSVVPDVGTIHHFYGIGALSAVKGKCCK